MPVCGETPQSCTQARVAHPAGGDRTGHEGMRHWAWRVGEGSTYSSWGMEVVEPTGCYVRQGGYIYRQGVEGWSVCGGVLVVRVEAAGLTVWRVVCSAMLALSLNSSSCVLWTYALLHFIKNL